MIPGFYTLKTCNELHKAPNGSFAAIGGRGQDNWLRLGKNEIRFTFSVDDNSRLLNWASSQSRDIYTHRNDAEAYMDWPIILLSSTPTDRQQVRVKAFSGDDQWALVDAIPYQAGGDYSAFTPDKHPEYWLKAYTYLMNGSYGASHNGLLFKMPLFDPMSGFKISSTAQSIGGLWVDANVLHSYVQPQPVVAGENTDAHSSNPVTSDAPLTSDEKQTLLRLAREALQHEVAGHSMPALDFQHLPPALKADGASFITLTIDGDLRGCIGALEPYQSLAEDVREHARQAALEDPRFAPVSPDELDRIKIEISRLTMPKHLEYTDGEDLISRLRPHVDGVILRDGFRRATFLPQVWEKIPDKADFLDNLCYKMGASPDAWRQKHLEVLTYQVEEFEE